MKSCQEFQFGAHLVPKHLPKVTNKLNVLIGHHSFRYPMQLDDIIKEQDGYSRRIGGFGTRDKVSHFRESVNYY